MDTLINLFPCRDLLLIPDTWNIRNATCLSRLVNIVFKLSLVFSAHLGSYKGCFWYEEGSWVRSTLSVIFCGHWEMHMIILGADSSKGSHCNPVGKLHISQLEGLKEFWRRHFVSCILFSKDVKVRIYVRRILRKRLKGASRLYILFSYHPT